MMILVALLLLPARANLGETVEQVVARYGKPVAFAEASSAMPFGKVDFRAGGYELLVFVLNDREVGARVSKLDKTAFTDAEIQTIMENDAGDTKWAETTSTDPTCREWSRTDKATVMYDKEKHMLILTSDAMAQALHAPAAKPAPLPVANPAVSGKQ